MQKPNSHKNDALFIVIPIHSFRPAWLMCNLMDLISTMLFLTLMSLCPSISFFPKSLMNHKILMMKIVHYALMPYFLIALRLKAFSVLFFQKLSNNLFVTAGILKSTERCLEQLGKFQEIFLFNVKDHGWKGALVPMGRSVGN